MSVDRVEYERWLMELSLDDVLDLFRENNASELLYKILPRNANSKNQVYVGPDLSQLGKIPSGSIVPVESTSQKTTGKQGPIFRASVLLEWITPSGALEAATGTKLIAYPQYPEVRLSGFLLGCRAAPSFLFNIDQCGHDDGRVLLLGPRTDGTVLALALPAASPVATRLREATDYDSYGVFSIVPLRSSQEGNGLVLLLRELCRIHRLGWVDSRRLGKGGVVVPCRASNCGGYTLEALLGIQSNGIAEPDFHGWEVKSRTVSNIEKPGSSRVTLFTPEPDGGAYAAEGAQYFIRRWGYPDTLGRPDRINFGGVYKCGHVHHARTGIQMMLDGYDEPSGKFDAGGAIRLVDKDGIEAASWSFTKLMDHWKRKHAHAAYVPCRRQVRPERSYRYASTVLLGEGAEFRHFLQAVASGAICYDPGIKLTNASGDKPKQKLRSQLRIGSRDLGLLYDSVRTVPVCA